MIFQRRETMKRCAEKVGLESLVDIMETNLVTDRCGTYLEARAVKAAPTESTQLGARCEGPSPPAKIPKIPEKLKDRLAETPKVSVKPAGGAKENKAPESPALTKGPLTETVKQVEQLVESTDWPKSARSYVRGFGVCAGVRRAVGQQAEVKEDLQLGFGTSAVQHREDLDPWRSKHFGGCP